MLKIAEARMGKQPAEALSVFSGLLLLLLTVTASASVKFKCNLDDYKVLLRIKKDLGDPYHLASWIPNTDCCNWYVVECDDNGRIVEFHLFQDNNISAQIPPSIGDLPYLQKLTFRHLAELNGEIPRAISKLNNLQFLWLSWTNLSGPVPDFLGQLKNLWFLDLSFNVLTGSIPASLADLPKLSGLNLGRNKLTGQIPDSFGKFTASDFYLRLSHNLLSGTIPRSLGDANFTLVELGRNMLQGDASFLLGRNKSIHTLDLSRNMFHFDLSGVEIPQSLEVLYIDHNQIYGGLPAGLAQLDHIYLNVSYNRLCGPIPVGSNLQSLDATAYFHNRCLCGSPLPACPR